MGKRGSKKEAVADAKAEVKQEVAVKQEQAVAVSSDVADLANWGNGGVSAQDIIIPRILLCQPMSQMVTNGDAKFCEFRESLSQDLVAGIDEKFEIIPFFMEKVWIEFNVDNPDDKKFLRVVPVTPANQTLPYEYDYKDENNKVCKGMRDYTMNFYVLRPEDIETGAALPYIISCRRSSLQAGKKLATQMFVKNQSAGKTPAATIMEVSATKTTNERKQTYAVMQMKPTRPTNDKYVIEAFKWLQLVQQGKAKAHEESYSEEARGEGFSDAQASSQPQASGPSRF